MKRHLFFLTIIIFAFLILIQASFSEIALPEKEQPVDVVTVKGAIFNSTANYIKRGIKEAENDGAICAIELDTPGGLITAMREIIQDISASKVPVVVFVYPHGAMATSAGAYITYSAHVAAMAPGTHIGSAHPVTLGQPTKRWKVPGENPFEFQPSPSPSEEPENSKPEKTGNRKTAPKKVEPEKEKKEQQPGQEVDVGTEKATNAMVALIRSLAEKNNRNADWGEKAVRESVSITAGEAVKLDVVEFQAEDLKDLLGKLKGLKVTLAGKKEVTLEPSHDKIKYIRMTGIERFLLTINDPQIAMILMFLGTLGLYYELAHPGVVVPGIIGSICIILGLYTMGSLPINYAALALIILSAILFISELFTHTGGALTLGGVISFVLGAVFLIPSGMPYLAISRSLIISLAIFMGLFGLIIIRLLVKSIRAKSVSGIDSIIGSAAVAKTEISSQGMVLLNGELWKAKSVGDLIPAGKPVEVEKIDGLLLFVREAGEKH